MAVRSAALDVEVLAFLAERARRTAAEFDRELGCLELPALEWGDQAELRFSTADGRPRIFVSREDPDWWRIRYQIAHEVFHWLCTPPRTFHWTHELLAVETAVRAMDEIGEGGYAAKAREMLSEEAQYLALPEMLTTRLDRGYYPDGLYGRAWVTGRQLISSVGWQQVKFLAASFNKRGKPDPAAWVSTLLPEEQALVEAVLGDPSREWI